MPSLRRVLLAVAALALAAPVAPSLAAPPDGRGDATVVAVIDSAFSPYAWDFLASRMPQARTRDRSDDLPLTKAPDTWLPGFPAPKTFGSYGALHLTLSSDEDDNPAELDKADSDVWSDVETSTTSDLHYYWLPGTKVIGAMTFGGATDKIHGVSGTYRTDDHGTGTTSVSVGNIHGTCPECLLVFLQYTNQESAEAAIDWAMRQPWIDAITNSYGFSTTGYLRDRVYNGSNVALQKQASERGQSIFFSAGNGMENAFTVPNSTLLSSEEGPDWILTVTATDPNGGTYTGTGKPADVAGIGTSYPSAYGAKTVSGNGATGFSGTSNATPTVAGTYARALYLARRALPGPSRIQSGGLIAKGSFHCGAKRPSCELAGGLTAVELRTRLLQGAISTGKGYTDGATGLVPPTPRAADTYYAAEGHGTYRARLDKDDAKWLAEFNRVWLPMTGAAVPPARPAGERDWFVVDSWCRQHIWGEWGGGYFHGGALPPDNSMYPTRTSLHASCQNLQQPPKS